MIESDKERRLRRGALVFFGRISASISHEFNNVVTIIGEVSGLLEDLCFLAEKGRPIDPQRLRKQCDLIAKQTGRAHRIIKEMNHFAHGVDCEEERFDLEDEVRVIVSLSERLASLKGFRFEFSSPVDALLISGQRFLVHELFFVLFRAIFEGGADGGVIEIVMGRDGSSPRVVVSGKLPNADGVEEINSGYPSLLAAELDCELEASLDEKDRVSITVTFPAST